MLRVAKDWQDYELLDAADGEKLERWGNYVLRRPDPQIIWTGEKQNPFWQKADGIYQRSEQGGGQWHFTRTLPPKWPIHYGAMRFFVKPTNFKHTGLFPEQAVNWDWIQQKITAEKRPLRILNLFAYTGGATIAAASAGAEVCHVDAAKGMVQWAKENAELSGLKNAPIRYIADDVFKFVQREIRRGSRYDAIIMDPPTYGRGPKGEMWKLETNLSPFLQSCAAILTNNPLFVLVNSYTGGFSPTVLRNLLQLTLQTKFKGKTVCGEIGLPIVQNAMTLPCGIYGYWEAG